MIRAGEELAKCRSLIQHRLFWSIFDSIRNGDFVEVNKAALAEDLSCSRWMVNYSINRLVKLGILVKSGGGDAAGRSKKIGLNPNSSLCR